MKRYLSVVFPVAPSARASVALLLLRVVVGAAFMIHGTSKIQNPFGWMGASSSMPGVLQALAALSEFGGGLAFILGAVVPLAAFGVCCTMLVALHTHLIQRGDPFIGKNASYELALVYFSVALLMLLAGPGRFSVDYFLRKKLT